MRGWKGIGEGLLVVGLLAVINSGMAVGGTLGWSLLGLILMLLGVVLMVLRRGDKVQWIGYALA